MGKKVSMKNLDQLLSLCHELADYIDSRGESGDNFTLCGLGLGYRVTSGYLREGMKAMIDLEEAYHQAIEEKKLAMIDRDQMRDFIMDVFGDKEVYTLCDKYKERIKKFVEEINEELYAEIADDL